MDLSLVSQRLGGGKHYTAPEAVRADLDLIVANCFAYNSRGDEVWVAGEVLAAAIAREWAAAGLPTPPQPRKQQQQLGDGGGGSSTGQRRRRVVE
jgi:hypothetical protein